MELKDYLEIAKRRLPILIVVPVVALVLVAGATLIKPTQYQATATVAAPALVGGVNANQYSGANGLKSFVANFGAAITSPPIIDKVNAETGVSKSTLHSGLSASEVGSSSLMEVHYRTGNRRTAGTVAQSAASETIRFLFNTQVTLAQQPVTAAQKSLDSTDADIAALTTKTGLVEPDQDYQVQSQAIANLESSQAQAEANGQLSTAERLQAVISQRQTALAQMAPVVQQYQTMVDKKNQAVTTLNQAQQALNQAKAQYEAADPSRVVTLGRTGKVSVLGPLAQQEAAALAGAVLLAVGIVVLLELLARPTTAAAPALEQVGDDDAESEPYVVRNPFGRTTKPAARPPFASEA